jgi:glycosyltransferase involved in cell wall biosynthesis
MPGMKTILVTVDPAFPPISGLELRAWQNAKAASELGPVLLLSIGPPGPGTPPPGITIRHLKGMDAFDVWRGDFEVRYQDDLIKHFRSAVLEFKPDIVMLESLPLTNLASVVRPYTKAVIIDLHNVESDLAAQALQSAKDPVRRSAIETRVRRIRAIENKASAVADMLWVCSSVDRDRLVNNGLNVKRIYVVPNGIPRPGSILDRPPRPDYCRRPILLFIGHLGYPPNVEAAFSLIGIMPALWNRIADARLVLAGRNPQPEILRRSQPGKIEVIANPSSTSPLLSSADLALMPLQRGGGTRIKALEAIAWGLPIVATARAVEGLGLENAIHVSIAETGKEFVSAICDLCENPARYEAQRIAARRYILKVFGQDANQTAVHSALREALQARPNTSANGEHQWG